MRFVLLVAIASVFAPSLGRKSRLVTRGLDDAAPLPTAAAVSGGQITNGVGRLTQCPHSTTACARHRPHADNGGARATPTLDCIDTDVDFRSCACCRICQMQFKLTDAQAGGAYFRTKGRIKERIARRLRAPRMRLVSAGRASYAAAGQDMFWTALPRFVHGTGSSRALLPPSRTARKVEPGGCGGGFHDYSFW